MDVKALAGGIGRAAKVWLLVSAVLMATVGLAQDARPADAAGPQIIISRSSTSPDPITSLVLNPGGPSLDLYVWAKDVKGPLGAGAFQIGLSYNSWLISVNSIAKDSVWLGSTGRTVWCSPVELHPHTDTGAGNGYVGCNTPTPPPTGSYGPSCSNNHCDGLLGRVTVQPGIVPIATALNFTAKTYLMDTGWGAVPVQEPEVIATGFSLPVGIVKCGDHSGDGYVNLFDDILSVIMHYQERPGDPGWDPKYDLDKSGNVDLFGDILGTVIQYQKSCYQTPKEE